MRDRFIFLVWDRLGLAREESVKQTTGEIATLSLFSFLENTHVESSFIFPNGLDSTSVTNI